MIDDDIYPLVRRVHLGQTALLTSGEEKRLVASGLAQQTVLGGLTLSKLGVELLQGRTILTGALR